MNYVLAVLLIIISALIMYGYYLHNKYSKYTTTEIDIYIGVNDDKKFVSVAGINLDDTTYDRLKLYFKEYKKQYGDNFVSAGHLETYLLTRLRKGLRYEPTNVSISLVTMEDMFEVIGKTWG